MGHPAACFLEHGSQIAPPHLECGAGGAQRAQRAQLALRALRARLEIPDLAVPAGRGLLAAVR
jgi:hypothetical protein